ncbi:MAG: glycosyltransferase family 2 protein, partial [Verrucomicrobia bacterium]|nr:glycosyltransferase family 2 protein [Verrucomicrobiota bacterium]
MKIVVVVPAYNEADRIREAMAGLGGLRERLAQDSLDLGIIVVNDGSTDDTGRLAADAGANRVVTHKVNQGLGAAVRTGLMAARRAGADIVVKFDGDLQHDPNDIPALIAPIVADEADVVYGNRFERMEYRMPFVRRVGNIVFTWLMRRLTRWPLKDSQPGIFAVNRAYLSDFSMPGDYNYTQQILVDAYHRGLRFCHVPVAFRRRMTGRSFVSLKYPLKVLPQIVRVLVCVKPLHVFGLIGLAFLLAAGVVAAADVLLWAR